MELADQLSIGTSLSKFCSKERDSRRKAPPINDKRVAPAGVARNFADFAISAHSAQLCPARHTALDQLPPVGPTYVRGHNWHAGMICRPRSQRQSCAQINALADLGLRFATVVAWADSDGRKHRTQFHGAQPKTGLLMLRSAKECAHLRRSDAYMLSTTAAGFRAQRRSA